MSDIAIQLRRCKRNQEKKIDLSAKNISYILKDIYNLIQLEHLDLSTNKITSVDDKIADLTNLKILNLSNNSIMNISQIFLQMKSLQALNLCNNPLVKQYEPLLKPENQTVPKLTYTLKQIFGTNDDEESKQDSKPGWLDEDLTKDETSTGNTQIDLMSKLLEKDSQFKEQQQKVDDLSKKLEKLEFKSSVSSKGLGISPYTETLIEANLNELSFGDEISQGGFSIVYKGVFRGCEVAIKKIFNPNITQDLLDELNNEVNMLAQLRHPSIVLLMGIVSKPPTLCIIQELVPKGDLFTFLHKTSIDITQKQKIYVAQQIASALFFMHSCQIAHRDLKTLNILLDDGFRLKLCDFGLARKFSDINISSGKFSGTPTYMAPELYQKKAYDHTVDQFAFGTLLWELFAREVPYDGLEPDDISRKVCKDDSLPTKSSIPSAIMDIVKQCRLVNPNYRPNFAKVYNDLKKM